MTMSITFQSLESLAPEAESFWREQLALQDPWKGLIGTPEWFSMMSAGSVKPAVVAVASDADGAVVAVLPLLFQFMDFGTKRALVARVCGGDLVLRSPQTQNTNAAEAYSPQSPSRSLRASVQILFGFDCSCLWGAIMAHDPDIQAIVLDHVDQSRVPMVRVSCGRGSGVFLYESSALMPHYRVVLPPSYEDFRKLRSASSLRKIEARERAMVREVGGECQLVEIRNPADWEPYVGDINRLMNAAWQAVRLGHGFDMENCRPAAERGWLRSFLLLVGGQPASFVLGYQAPSAQLSVNSYSLLVNAANNQQPITNNSTQGDPNNQQPITNNSTQGDPNNQKQITDNRSHACSGGVFHYEQIGHDAAIAKFSSPGTSLLYRLVKRLYERDTPKCVDFGEGEAEYKKALSNHITYTQSVLIVRNRLGWRVHFGLMRLARWMKGTVVVVTEKLGVRKRIAKFLKYRA